MDSILKSAEIGKDCDINHMISEWNKVFMVIYSEHLHHDII